MEWEGGKKPTRDIPEMFITAKKKSDFTLQRFSEMKNVKNATLAVLKLITLMLDNQVQEKRSTIKQTVRTLNPILKCELWVTNILGSLLSV